MSFEGDVISAGLSFLVDGLRQTNCPDLIVREDIQRALSAFADRLAPRVTNELAVSRDGTVRVIITARVEYRPNPEGDSA